MFDLMPLPYAQTALEPYLSAKTIHFHHGKHHRAYVETLNGLIEGTVMSTSALEEIIQNTAGRDAQRPIFNNAGQVWNHNFFWSCMRATGGRPNRAVEQWLDQDLGGLDAFKDTLKKAAVGRFGSGWAWLVLDADGKLNVTTTSNADSPMVHGQTALLTCDVWEHAFIWIIRTAGVTLWPRFSTIWSIGTALPARLAWKASPVMRGEAWG